MAVRSDYVYRYTWAGRFALKVGEERRLAIDFANLDELETESLTGTPTVTVLESGSGIVITSPAIANTTQVAWWADCTAAVVATGDLIANGGNGYTEYTVEATIGTTGGATLVREATLRVEE